MRTFNEFSGLWRAATFNRAFYQDVALNWRGIGASYLFLLVMLTWLVLLIQMAFSMTNFLNNEAPKALETFPPITIHKGVVSSDVPQPYIMKSDQGQPLFVLDTTGQVKKPSDVGATFLLTDTEFIQEQNGRLESHSLNDFPDVTLDRDTILGWIRLARNALVPAGLVCCADLAFAGRILLALLFALIGLAFNNAFHGGLKYQALLRLSVVCMTGPVLLDTLRTLLRVPSMCFLGWFIELLALVYLAYAVKVAAEVVPREAPPNYYAPPPPPQDLPPGPAQFP